MRSAILGFTAGAMLLQQQAALPAWQQLLLMVLLALLLAWVARRWKTACRTAAHAAAGLAIGFAWAGGMAQIFLERELPKEWEGRDIAAIGVIDSLPVFGEQSVRFQFAIEKILAPAEAPANLPARVALSWFVGAFPSDGHPAFGIRPGQRWQFNLRLRRPHGNANPNGFDYEVWLLEQNLRATGHVTQDRGRDLTNMRLDEFVFSTRALIERSRELIRTKILAALEDEPYAGVIAALVIGDQRGIDQSSWKIFNRTGVGHLMSISGLHITMIAGLFAGLVSIIWRRSFFTSLALPLVLPAQKASAIAGASAALVYVLLAGFGVPAQRTLYMLLVIAAALWFGRITAASHVLCLALGVVVLLDPWAVLWPGLWLSFGAVGLILYSSVGRVGDSGKASGNGVRAALRSGVHTQYVVTIGLIPLTMLLFGQFSLISPVANAIAIPLVSFLVTPLALLGSVSPEPVAGWLFHMAHWLVSQLASLLEILSALPFAVWSAPLPDWWMFVIALAGVVWLLAPAGWPARWFGLFCLLPLALHAPSAPKAGEMWVTAFDVGQGTALLVETPRRRLLYDTGPAYGAESNAATRVILPYLKARGIDRLDAIVISHSDMDHAGGALSMLEAMDVGWVSSSLPASHPLIEASREHRRCEAGQHWEWDGVRFDMLHPSPISYEAKARKPNTISCTLKVTLDVKSSLLLTGDIEAAQELELLGRAPEYLRSTVLLAPHHGSGTSSSLAFLDAVAPELALFQVGYRNRYQHPKREVFERYAELGIRRVRSDESGAVTLRFGRELEVIEFRNQSARYWHGR